MELDQVPEIGAKQAKALKRAGVKSAEDLSLVQDVDVVAKKAMLPADKLMTLRAAARLHIERTLAQSGVGDEADLMKADLDALSKQTGITVEHLTRYQDAARKVAREAPPAPKEAAPAPAEVPASEPAPEPAGEAEAAPEPEPAPAPEPAAAETPAETPATEPEAEERTVRVPVTGDDKERVPDKVVLEETSPTAVVFWDGRRLEGVPIVTAREADDGEATLAAAEGDAVLLQEKAVVAPTRIGGLVRKELPIFSMRADEDGSTKEIRVKVHALRENGGAPAEPAQANGEKPKAAAGLMGRFLKRKG